MSTTARTPPWLAFLRQPVNWLLAGAPAALALEAAGAPAPLIFLAAGLALIPLATLIVHSTEEIAAGIPNARLEVFENSGHSLQLEESEKFLALVREFLAS